MRITFNMKCTVFSAVFILTSLLNCSCTKMVDEWIDSSKKPDTREVTTLSPTISNEPIEVEDDTVNMSDLPDLIHDNTSYNDIDTLPEIVRPTEPTETIKAPEAVYISETIVDGPNIEYIDENREDIGPIQNLTAIFLKGDMLLDSIPEFCSLIEGCEDILAERVNEVIISMNAAFIDYTIVKDELVDNAIRIDGVYRDASTVPLLVAEIVSDENGEFHLITNRIRWEE